jgi:hypothetical protein
VTARSVCDGCGTCLSRQSCLRVTRTGGIIEFLAKSGGGSLFFLGSLLFATTRWAGETPWVFMVFLGGHFFWAIAGIVMRDRGTILTNIMYLAFDISAIWIRL